MIPLDGKIISGETTVDEALPENPSQKTSVLVLFLFAGTLNKMVLLETTTLSIDTTLLK
jgi:Cd2+/Zn2+-exporting ATPase